MSSTLFLTTDVLQHALRRLAVASGGSVSSSQLVQATGASPSTVKRVLAKLLAQGLVQVSGRARATRYRLAAAQTLSAGPNWCADSQRLRNDLNAPLASRAPVTYRREFVDNYQPNHSSLLPRQLADELAALGRLPGQLPAGTYVRKVLEQLLIDLSWWSSRLEGNRYTLLDTERLFLSGAAATDADAVMLLNHKAAIEFMVDAAPMQGLATGLIRNLHAVLMQDLLSDVQSLGAIREKVVHISGTTYVPTQVPMVLHEMFEQIIGKATLIKNPVEAAFFLWVNLAYLQPFEDGNKRVSRLAANIPLMLYNQAPLSFLDVERDDYALAMMGIYEVCDVSLAVDLFAWTYRRSHARYQVVSESLGAPDPFRVRHRETLNTAVSMVVRARQPVAAVLAALALADDEASAFAALLAQELEALAEFNCARYRLGARETQAWIADGRPA